MSLALIDCEPLKNITSAKNTFQVPKVTMKGGRRNLVTNHPFIYPHIAALAIPTIIAKEVGNPICTDSFPINTEASTIIAATLRSIPAVKIIKV